MSIKKVDEEKLRLVCSCGYVSKWYDTLSGMDNVFKQVKNGSTISMVCKKCETFNYAMQHGHQFNTAVDKGIDPTIAALEKEGLSVPEGLLKGGRDVLQSKSTLNGVCEVSRNAELKMFYLVLDGITVFETDDLKEAIKAYDKLD